MHERGQNRAIEIGIDMHDCPRVRFVGAGKLAHVQMGVWEVRSHALGCRIRVLASPLITRVIHPGNGRERVPTERIEEMELSFRCSESE
jgi:hypothetical protein